MLQLRVEDQWAEDHGIHVGYCHRHKVKVWDEYCEDCDKEDADGWLLCGECEEYRYEDARVEGGMKCGVCAYG